MPPATSDGQKHNAAVSGFASFIFASFPPEIVRLVLEASVAPGVRAGDERQRQRTAYAYCLLSKGVRASVEPLLYEKVVLESLEQVTRFLRALQIKPVTFLARAVKTVWILNEYLPRNTVEQLHIVFSKCRRLKRLTIIDDEFSIELLRNIPKARSGPYALQELTIVSASVVTAKRLALPHLPIQKLILIDCSFLFFETLLKRTHEDTVLRDTLRAIPQIYLDFITIPNVTLASHLKSIAIPLWIHPSSESISVLRIRSSSTLPARRTDPFIAFNLPPQSIVEYFDNVDSWIKYFEADVQECGGRLVVYALSDAEVGSNPEASYIERCMAWIGLD